MKRIANLLLPLLLLLNAAACGQTGTQSPDVSAAGSRPAQSGSAEEQSVPDRYPMTLTDQAGRTVTLQKEPERIVSGYYVSTSMLIALGQKDKLVGIEAKADMRDIYRLSAPELISLPSVGSAKELDLEGCAALEPDLVILPLKLKSAAGALEELGIPVLLVDPEDEARLEETIGLLFRAVQGRERGQALLSFIGNQRNHLLEQLGGAPQPRVYLGGNSSFLSTAGGQMYQTSMIRNAWGENVAQEIEDAYWVEVDYEQILAWDPEYIILASGASYTCEDVLSNPSLADCTAVRSGNVYQMPSKAEAWDSPVPSGILGSVWLAGVLHPDLFSQAECDQIIEEYYETFYGFSYSQA